MNSSRVISMALVLDLADAKASVASLLRSPAAGSLQSVSLHSPMMDVLIMMLSSSNTSTALPSKSNRSNTPCTFALNVPVETRVSPLRISRASVTPLLSVSQRGKRILAASSWRLKSFLNVAICTPNPKPV